MTNTASHLQKAFKRNDDKETADFRAWNPTFEKLTSRRLHSPEAFQFCRHQTRLDALILASSKYRSPASRYVGQCRQIHHTQLGRQSCHPRSRRLLPVCAAGSREPGTRWQSQEVQPVWYWPGRHNQWANKTYHCMEHLATYEYLYSPIMTAQHTILQHYRCKTQTTTQLKRLTTTI